MTKHSPPDWGVSRRRVLAGVGTVAAVAVAGCSGTVATDDYDVGMTAAAFDPPGLTIDAGETVVWANTSSRGHTVTAYGSQIPEGAEFFASGGYESTEVAREAFRTEFGGVIDSGESWSHTFKVPGEYEYFCIPHEQSGMVGTITVKE